MSPDPTQSRLDDLLRHAEWARRLARRLVGNLAAADDLVQDAWLAGMRAPPPAGVPERAWLAGTLRNLALRWKRGLARRRRRESAAAGPDETHLFPEDLARRLEGQRILAEAVASLDEPFRTAVVLKHFDGLTAAAIARRQGVPAATVRWRLMRGYELLRERLDRGSGGDRRAWSLAVVPLLGPPPLLATLGIAAAKAVQGVLTMKLKSQALAAVAVLLIAVAGYRAFRGVEQEAGPATGGAPANAEAAAATPPPAPSPGGGEPAPVMSASPLEAPRNGPSESEPARGKPTTIRIVARCIEESGAPIAGAVLTESRHPEVFRAESGPDGSVDATFPLPVKDLDWTAARLGRGVVIFVHRPGFVAVRRRATIADVETNDLGEFVLARGGGVAGRVLDDAGAPITGAWVFEAPLELPADQRASMRSRLFKPSDEKPSVRTDAAGRFEIWLPPGRHRVLAGAPGFGYDGSEPVDVAVGATAGPVELRLSPAAATLKPTNEGIVLDPEGRPVPGARVTVTISVRGSRRSSGSVACGEDGRFHLGFSAEEAESQMTVTAQADDESLGDAFIEGIAPGFKDLEIRLPRARTILLRVADAQGTPLSSWKAAVFEAGADLDGFIRPTPLFWTKAEPGPAGTLPIRVPSQPFQVEVDAAGHELGRLGPYDPATLPGELSFRLQRLPGVRGRVRHGAAGIAGAAVAVHEDSGPDHDMVCNGFPSWVRSRAVAEARSGEDGVFEIGLRKAGLFRIDVEAEGLAPLTLGPFEFDPRRGLDGLDFDLGEGGVLEGKVIPAEGRRPGGTIVAISQGGLRILTERVASDGAYRFTGLAAGPWMMTTFKSPWKPGNLHLLENRGARQPFPWACEVRPGATTRHDLDLREGPAISVEGTLVFGDRSAGAWSVRLENRTRTFDRTSIRADLDAQGRFRAAVPRPGTWELVATLNGPAHTLAELTDRVEVVAPETTWSRAIPTATLRWTPGAGDAVRPLRHEWSGEGGLRVTTFLHPEAPGQTLELTVPAGRGEIRPADPQGNPGAVPLRIVELPAGGTSDLDIR